MWWLLQVCKNLVVSILAFPLAPIIVLLTTKAGESPLWAFYWLTYDNTIDGDKGHWERWPDNGTAWRRYCRRVAWLWRNKAYNYAYHKNRVKTVEDAIIVKGNTIWKDINPRGFCYAKCGDAWMIFAWYPYTIFGVKRGLRLYLGWKLRNKIDNPSSERAMLCYHINPFKGKI